MNNLTILVVDDEPQIRMTVRQILEDDGHTVMDAGSGEECIRILDQCRVDIVLLDIQLPGVSGMETFKRMCRDKYRVDTIMMSGHGTIETAVEAIRHGAHDFLEKPFSIAKLRQSIAAVAHKRLTVEALQNQRAQGTVLDKYTLGEEIASGAFATVYRAEHTGLRKTVALKVLHPRHGSDRTFTERFLREARIMASLSPHPNIVPVFDFGESGGLHYLAMEYVDGAGLDAHLSAETRFSLKACAQAGAQICAGLGHAHGKGVVHRDIKPQNVLIDKSGAVKLVDFGLARCLTDSGEALTREHEALGTPQFMSPEQISGGEITPATDIFSLGILLYLITTLRAPFAGGNIAAVMRSIIDDPVMEPHVHNEEMGDDFSGVIMRCLEKKPENRFGSVGEIMRELEKI